MTDRLLGAPVAAALDQETRAIVASAPLAGGAPCLASLHRGVDGPFRRYLNGQRKAADALGLRFREEVLDSAAGQAGFVEQVRALDRDPTVHGLIVEHPLPPPFDFENALSALRAVKDVDGVGTENLGRLVTGTPGHAPAVALGAVRIAAHYRLPVEGARVAVVGRSSTVGLPLALLLARRGVDGNATVTVAHSKTPDLASALVGVRTIFSCAGSPRLLTRSNVPEGAAVVDIGLSSVSDASRPSGSRMAGDADPESLEGWAGAVSPVPGGVGPVTVAQLMWNTARAWQLQTPGGTR